MLVDTHAHLDMQAFDKDRAEVIARALEGGITHILTVGIDLESSLRALELARSHDSVFATVGCHPHEAQALGPQDLRRMEALASEPAIVAWGEVGLDFFHRHSAPDVRCPRRLFPLQRALAPLQHKPQQENDHECNRGQDRKE